MERAAVDAVAARAAVDPDAERRVLIVQVDLDDVVAAVAEDLDQLQPGELSRGDDLAVDERAEPLVAAASIRRTSSRSMRERSDDMMTPREMPTPREEYLTNRNLPLLIRC